MNRTVLSINANKPMNYLLQTVLSEKYEFIAVTDVYDGMSHLKKNNELTVIIADIDNADQEVWEFIEHINSSKMYQKPVIILSSDNNSVIDEKMAELGLRDLVRKPFSPTELVKKIDEIMLIEFIDE